MDASHFDAGLVFGAVTSDPSVARRVGDKRVSHLSGCAHLEIALLVGWSETLKKKGGGRSFSIVHFLRKFFKHISCFHIGQGKENVHTRVHRK